MLPDAPYPEDTRAKGWRFELDHERIRQSDTWALATSDARPWLLMLWMVAWEQTPCGALPADDELIAARLGMSSKAFAKHRSVLLRGWEKCSDGKLYHPTITQRVLEMLARRRKEAERKAAARGRTPPEGVGNTAVVTELSRGTGAGLHPESDTGTGTGETSSMSSGKKRASAPPRPVDVAEQVWSDWLTLRKAKRAPVTETVIDGARSEAGKASMSLEAFLRIWCRRGTQGLEASWLKDHERAGSAKATERQAEVAKWLGPLAPKQTGEVFDMEDGHAPRIAVR